MCASLLLERSRRYEDVCITRGSRRLKGRFRFSWSHTSFVIICLVRSICLGEEIVDQVEVGNFCL